MRGGISRHYQRQTWAVQALGFALAASILSGCFDRQVGANYTKKCAVAEDQAGTFNGRWPVVAIPVGFANGQFNDSERALYAEGAAVWNRFYSYSRGYPIFSVNTSGNNTQNVSSSNLGYPGIIKDGAFTGEVVVRKVAASWAYDAGIIAVTQVYTNVSNGSFRKITNALQDFNFVNYWAPGKKQPDFKSIVVHELGHLFGLNHSCEWYTKEGMPHCANASTQYVAAALYPVVYFPDKYHGEVRDQVRTNDQERANCMYDIE